MCSARPSGTGGGGGGTGGAAHGGFGGSGVEGGVAGGQSASASQLSKAALDSSNLGEGILHFEERHSSLEV